MYFLPLTTVAKELFVMMVAFSCENKTQQSHSSPVYMDTFNQNRNKITAQSE